jgi:3-phenylpropionate/trans-cinnamate dioxygenase ferredoxin subunit
VVASTRRTVEDVAPGQLATLDVEGVRVAVANVDGEYFAFEDSCTHRGCSFDGGTLEGRVLTCACHGSQFDVTTGEATRGPASIPLSTYAVDATDAGLRVVRATSASDATEATGGGVLAEVPLFSALDRDIVDALEAFTFRRTFQPGELIVEEDTTGNGMYVVLSGRVEVVKGLDSDRPTVLAIRGPGEPFGELALLGEWKRMASIRALDEVDCLGIDRWVFLSHLEREPRLAVRLLQVLAQRLSEESDRQVE